MSHDLDSSSGVPNIALRLLWRIPGTRSPGPGSQDVASSPGFSIIPQDVPWGNPTGKSWDQGPGTGVSVLGLRISGSYGGFLGAGARDRGLRTWTPPQDSLLFLRGSCGEIQSGTRSPGPGSQVLDSSSGVPQGVLWGSPGTRSLGRGSQDVDSQSPLSLWGSCGGAP